MLVGQAACAFGQNTVEVIAAKSLPASNLAVIKP
jgi:hypothetical protein